MRIRKFNSSENCNDTTDEITTNKKIICLYDISNKCCEFISFCFGYSIKIIKIFINISGIYLVWIFLHFIASHLYVRLCVPNTLIGFLLSPFMTATPHCQGLRWVVFNAANMINNMWIILGSWIMRNILVINKDTVTP